MSSIRRLCSVENCDKLSLTRGWCDMHYHRFWRNGSTDDPKASAETHGLSKTPEHTIWLQMRYRCHNPNATYYADYGGRGITVCKRWERFTNFLADMGKRPSSKHSIDRIDPNGNYEPGNCRWTTSHVQAWNKRRSKRNTTGYTGVYKNNYSNRWNEKPWFAKIRLEDGSDFTIGGYDTIEEAAIAYDMASIFFRGHSKTLNILQ